ncbi:Sulfoacetaldehyde acetyltransferase [Paraburkholderia domus]|jgi:sulfoacetaldehyde acetyltransferase|uniref:Sulfoacetaldehyde acetyltransferase n=1 Tax=Paraburkholderia domus TaxID=2793075 RepID=A0A9N8N5N2_9BURK|nr:sulfoacetaldehyde acetyltransferase [Paraburkholderia domus]MBK5053492.1 sulfoacetaldehyde acetyltransferase [Burkholderia sp. R-70006]MBK5063884.1 sulfoacetaldehyde acetyltransferase [Burkholderia sp. R-70199]MBK5090342.1 sulfoacetaldehyde acetyltransferase [Burkholderia sp. R-69927]MBK5124898.1 sulfoacetaldehyde acetyltransferase [Burkholderia sp. R-69980]MBK5169226.1 sulfoacetaldehyde acetyltransferase [Burkholderia sp. R-70211]MBK5184624.1 sulfoacetaldehyde acetyltransferase [Burkholde
MSDHTPISGPQAMTPSEAFVETLAANGVTDMFGIMGSAFMDAMDIFAPAGIRLIPVVHEQGAGHMADGYARVSGRHGVVIGQNGPGISNCVTAIAAAYWAHSPVVMITPEAGTMGIGLGGFQEAKQLPMFQEFTKYQGHVTHPARMAEFTGRCFDRALAEMGPTQLNIPRDYFYGQIKAEIPQPQRLDRGPGGDQRLNEAAELLAEAKFPVIISGGGVVMADAIEECKALAERLGAPVVNSYLHNDSFPASHPLWCGPLGYQGSKAAMKLIQRADVVIALGSRLGPFGTLPQHGMDYWPQNAKIIQIDADHKMLGLVKKISVGICGDAKAAAVALTQRLDGRTLACDATREERASQIAAEKAAWEKELDGWTHERDPYSLDMIEEQKNERTPGGGNYLHPRQVLRELEKAMPEDVMVSTDIGNINSVANSYLRFNKPRSFFAAMSWGNCGYAFPTIIGAKVAAPHRPAVSYAGDGAWGMSLMETMTCVRHNIPVTAVVFHNRQWGAEKKNQVDFYNRRFVAGELDNQSFADIARAMGAEGITVDRLEDVGPALKRAIDAQMNHGKTTIIEIMCTRELGDPFRRDALAKPVRLLDKYKDYV